jgi:hypothetical protein
MHGRARDSALTGSRTFVVFDGLMDPFQGRELSRIWTGAGFENAVDVAGQSAWLAWRDAVEGEAGLRPLTESQMDRARLDALACGVQLRDRTGSTFRGDNDLAELRRSVSGEYRQRTAVAFMFGLPVLLLHALGPYLAGSAEARDMMLPWLFEMLLCGWACYACGWPVIWSGVAGLVRLRSVPDLLTTTVVVVAFVPSVAGVVSVMVGHEPWYDVAAGQGPRFYAAVLALWLALGQRWLVHLFAAKLAGHAHWMLGGIGRLVALWLAGMLLLAMWKGWSSSLAFGLLMPPALSLGAVNRWSPGWTSALPVPAFAIFMLLGPDALALNIEGHEITIAAGFGAIMTITFLLGWSTLQPKRDD